MFDKFWLRNFCISSELYPTARRVAVIAPELEPAKRLICDQMPRFSKTWKIVEKDSYYGTILS